RDRLRPGQTAQQILSILGRYLFDEFHFAPNEQEYYDPDNSYFNRVLDRRTGNPISLCLLYYLVGRRLMLPISGISLPDHFVCRFQTATEEVYVDAFNRGRLLTRGDCVKFLIDNNHSAHDLYLTPASPRRMLLKMCANLHQIYVHRDRGDEAGR